MSRSMVEPVGTLRSKWGEGPVWWRGRLLYVDIEGHRVIRFDPATGKERVWDLGERVGCVVPREDGGWLIAGDSGISRYEPDTETRTPVADPEAAKRPDNRFNDGKCDPSGRLWAGTISLVKNTGDATLYRLDHDRLTPMVRGLTNSNGLCWSADARTMYHIDTPQKAVRAFDFDNISGQISNPRVAVDFAAHGVVGSPDGMTIDTDGKLWVAVVHAGAVICACPDTGELLERISLPCVETTSCTFGGAGLDELYVTTGMKSGLDESLAGRVFVVQGLGVRGRPAVPYAG